MEVLSTYPVPVLLLLLAPPKTPETERHKTMEICVESFDGEKYTVEVGVDDTTADIRRKVATAAELREDGFDMSFGGKLLAEGDYITQLSAGDTVVLLNKTLSNTKSQKDDAISILRDLGQTRLAPERFKYLTNAKLIHLFLQAEVVTEIPHCFLFRATFEALDLSGVPGVSKIASGFLELCKSLHTADLSGWSNVTRFETSFLSSCTALRTVDLSGWNNVRHIGDYFLESCLALTSLDLSGWHNVTHVGKNFLHHCIALRTLNLSGWSNVTQVGNCFLYNCKSLTTLDLSGWSNVTQVGHYFLFNCSALKTLNLSGWTNAKDIEKGFLKGCKIPTSSINVAGSSSVVSEYVQSRSLMDYTRHKCVCM